MKSARVVLAAITAATMVAVTAAPAHAQPRSAKKPKFRHVSGGASATLGTQKLEVKSKITLVGPEILDCNIDVLVKFQRKVGGKWKTVGSDTTNKKGVAKVIVADKTGKYRAVAPLTQSEETGFDCFKATSAVARHSH